MTRRSLKAADWPAGDRAGWRRLFADGGLLDDPGALAHLRPETRWSYEQSYGHWLGFLSRRGVDLEATEPAGRASADLIAAWVAVWRD